MGSGKTTVGRIAARQLGWRFIDIDRVVRRRSGMAVDRIFRERGEGAFRRLESRALAEAARGRDQVVATGGGAAGLRANVAAMRASGLVVWLNVSFVRAARRIQKQGAARRPLAPRGPREPLKRLFASRLELYRKAAHWSVPAGGAAPSRIAARIVRRMEREAAR